MDKFNEDLNNKIDDIQTMMNKNFVLMNQEFKN